MLNLLSYIYTYTPNSKGLIALNPIVSLDLSFKQASKVAFRQVPGQGDTENHLASSLTVDGQVSSLSNANGLTTEFRDDGKLNHVQSSSDCAELVSYLENDHSYY